MLLHWEDRDWPYDPQKITVAQAMVIKDRSGWGLKTFSQRVDDWDPLAAQLLLWIVKAQNGVTCDPSQQDFSLPQFMTVFTEACMAEVKAMLAAEQAQEKAAGKKRPKDRAANGRAGTKTPTSAATEASGSSSSGPSFT